VYNGAEKLVKQYEFTVKEIWCSRDGLNIYGKAFMIADVSPYSAWLSPKYIADASSVHLYGSFTDYEGPVYIFHGGLDNWAPISYSQKAVREYKNAQLFTFPSEDHGFSAKSNREVGDKIIEVILKEGGGHQTR
jgi:pimeloyl-ACP methyl ester carboxylesterase